MVAWKATFCRAAQDVRLCLDAAQTAEDISIDARLQLQEKIGKLTKLIEKTERAAWKEV